MRMDNKYTHSDHHKYHSPVEYSKHRFTFLKASLLCLCPSHRQGDPQTLLVFILFLSITRIAIYDPRHVLVPHSCGIGSFIISFLPSELVVSIQGFRSTTIQPGTEATSVPHV